MSKRPEEILKAKEQDIAPMVEAIDKELEARFEGGQLYIDEPKGLNSFGFKALEAHYNKHGWQVKRESGGKNDTLLSFFPLSELRPGD